MRRVAAQIEALGAARFTLLIGLVAGTIQGVPRLFLGGGGAVQSRLTALLIIGVVAVFWWTAALFLWWIAVRRRQSSLWAIAAQVTLGLIIGEVFATVISMVGASIDSRGEFASALAEQPLNFLVSNLALPALRSPVWFIGSALAIGMGRRLIGSQLDGSRLTTAATPPESVT